MIIRKNYAAVELINDVRLQIITLGHASTACEWDGSIKSPMYARLYYIIGGDPYVIINGKKTELRHGHCYLFPTGFSFRHACNTTMEQLYFHINLNDYNGTDLLRECKEMMEYKPAEGTIERILDYFYSESLEDTLKLRHEVYASLFAMLDKYSVTLTSSNYSRCVMLALKYIKSHLSLQIGIEELAAIAFVSDSTLAKKFRQEVGTTIGNYIDSMIMFEAEQLLLKTDMTVLQISERFGFCDQFYFSRKFKQKYGETPHKYRKLKLI